MQNKLWFNQAGESYNGIPCDDIYGGCPVSQGGTPIVDANPPVPLAIPAPNATDTQIANDPGYLQVLADGSVVDANGNVVSQGTDDGLAPVQPMLQAGQRVSKVVAQQCITIPCPQSAYLMIGTVTGIIQKTLPAKYEIIWDNGTSSFDLESDVTPMPNQPIVDANPPVPLVVLSSEEKFCQDKVNGMSWEMVDPNPNKENYYATCVQEQLALGDGTVFTPPSPVVVEPPLGAKSCGEDKYALPIQIGEEKCIDKTLALVLGALAIYYIMTKK